MANIPIRDMTLTGTPTPSSKIVFDDGQMKAGLVSDLADAARPFASQSEAEAGSSNTKTMTPLRTKQSIAAEVGSSVQAYNANLVTWAGKTIPSGDVVGTTDAQTLSGKTIDAGDNTITGLAKTDVGLGNVDNTSDASKPVSTATQTALDLKADTADLGTAAAANTTDFATAAQGTKADSAVQPEDLGTAAAEDATAFATAAQGAAADSAVQPGDLATVATSGSYTDLAGKPYTVPVGGTTGQVLTKASGTDGDTEWGEGGGGGGGGTETTVSTVSALKGLDTSSLKTAILTEDGRAGIFNFLAGDYGDRISADTNEGVYIKADDTDAADAAWVRLFDFVNYDTRWFGAVADHSTDNTTLINSIIGVTQVVNTLTTAGKQSAAFIEVEGGVRFYSKNLSFLPSADNVFVYLRYFANSDLSKGVPDGGGGTNEYMELSVNSGYPGSGTGGMVAEWAYTAPLHPAIMLNVAKQVSGADAHFNGDQVRIPDDDNPARASINVKDENVLRWRAVYEGYGESDISHTALMMQPFMQMVSIANVGTPAWTSVPANGSLITGVTTGAQLIKTTHDAFSITGYWVAGSFAPGEFVTDGTNTSSTGISGGGVVVTSSTNPYLAFGVNNPVVTYGVRAGYSITGFDIGARLTLRKSTGSTGASNHKETVTNAGLLFTNTDNAIPSTGRQIILDANNRLVSYGAVTLNSGSSASHVVNAVGAACQFNTTPAVATGSFNVTSISYLSAGRYQVNFTNALASANTHVSVSSSNVNNLFAVTSRTSSNVIIQCYNTSRAAADLASGSTCDVIVTGGW